MSVDQGLRYNSGAQLHTYSLQNENLGLNLNRLLNEVSEAPQHNQNFNSSDPFSSEFGTSGNFGSKFSNDLFGSKFSSSNDSKPLQSLKNCSSQGNSESSFSNNHSIWSNGGSFSNQSSGSFSTQSHGNFPSQILMQSSSCYASPFSDSSQEESSLFSSLWNLPTLSRLDSYSSQYSNSNSLFSTQPSAKASSSNLLGLSDISSRLEGLSQGSLSPKSRSSRGSSPLASISSPEDDFVFFSDDEDENSGKPKSPKKHNQAASIHDKMQTTIRGIAKLKVSQLSPNCSSTQSAPSCPQNTSWAQITRTSFNLPSLSRPVTRSSITPSPPPKPEAQPVTEELMVPTTTTLDYHRGPKVDPRWPVAQQVFLGPIPMSISWDEIRNVFYTKVQRRELLHFYVQSKPVNEVVYGQVVFDKVALANRILKEGPVKVRGHLINVTSMKEKLKQDKKK